MMILDCILQTNLPVTSFASYFQWCGSETVGLRTRPVWDQKIGLGLAAVVRMVVEAEASGGGDGGVSGVRQVVSPTLPFPLSLPSPFPFPLSFQANQWEGRSDPVRGGSSPASPLQIPPCIVHGDSANWVHSITSGFLDSTIRDLGWRKSPLALGRSLGKGLGDEVPYWSWHFNA